MHINARPPAHSSRVLLDPDPCEKKVAREWAKSLKPKSEKPAAPPTKARLVLELMADGRERTQGDVGNRLGVTSGNAAVHLNGLVERGELICNLAQTVKVYRLAVVQQ